MMQKQMIAKRNAIRRDVPLKLPRKHIFCADIRGKLLFESIHLLLFASALFWIPFLVDISYRAEINKNQLSHSSTRRETCADKRPIKTDKKRPIRNGTLAEYARINDIIGNCATLFPVFAIKIK